MAVHSLEIAFTWRIKGLEIQLLLHGIRVRLKTYMSRVAIGIVQHRWGCCVVAVAAAAHHH